MKEVRLAHQGRIQELGDAHDIKIHSREQEYDAQFLIGFDFAGKVAATPLVKK